MKQRKESDIKHEITKYLKLRGCVVVPQRSVGIYKKDTGKFIPYMKGISDLLCCYRSMFVALEGKRPGKKPNDNQQAFLAAVIEAGGLASVVTCIDDVDRVMGW